MAKTKLNIAVDAGHGLYTPGKRCLQTIDAKSTREWVLNSRIVEKLVALLKDYDCNVIRLDDPTGVNDISVSVRRDTANLNAADFVISVHHNAGVHGGSGGGTVVYYDPTNPKSAPYGLPLYEAIVAQTGLIGNRSKKVNVRSLAVCRANCPGILIENGFMDSTVDTPIILTDEHATKTAQGILNFITGTLGVKKKDNPEPEQPTIKKVCYIGKVISNDTLNVRLTPTSKDYTNILTVLNPNDYALVLEEWSTGWVKIKMIDGKIGYVFGKYLKKYTEGDFRRRVVVDNTGLNMRDMPNTQGKLLATMPMNAIFMILNKNENNWGLVWCGETIGYSSLSDNYSMAMK